MSTEIMNKYLLGFLVLCVIGLGVQAFYLWRMDQQLAGLDAESGIPERIMERLEDDLHEQPDFSGFGITPGLFGPSSVRDPFQRMQQMQAQMDSLFNSFSAFPSASAKVPLSNMQRYSFSPSMPALEFTENEDEYQVRVQTAQDQDVTLSSELEGNLLTLRGTVSSKMSNNSSGFATNIVSNSQFARSFDLDKPVDEFGVVTEQTEGGLLIRVPKKA